MHAPKIVLGASMFLTGAAGLIYEYVLSTVNTYLIGNSIEQFSVVIGAMFGMMGVGAYLQRFIRSGLTEWFVATQLTLVVLGGFSPIAMQWAFAFQPDSFSVIRWAYICAIGLLVGMEAPLVARINESFTSNLKNNLANTWGMDYIGGVAGVIVWIALLKNHTALTHISFVVAGANLIVALITLGFFWRRGMLSWRISGLVSAGAATVVVVATVFGWSSVGDWSKVINQKLYEDPIVFQASTPYQQIVMTKGQHPTDIYGANYELYLNGNKQFSSVDEAIYHELLVHPAMNAAAARTNVLVLGGGDGLATRELLKYPDVQNITLVDLDPAMTDLARTNPVLSELNEHAFDDARVHAKASKGVTDSGKKEDVYVATNESESTECGEVVESDGSRVANCSTTMKTESIGQVSIFNVDADRFISEASGPWDVVIIDLPDPNSIELSKLYSLEFYQKVKRNMTPDAVVVVQSTSPYHAKETFLCIMRTLSAAGFGVVPYHANVPSFGDWGWVMGSPSLDSGALRDKLQSIDTFGVPTKEIDPQVLKSALVFNKGWLDSVNATISTLMEPTVFQYYEYEGWKVE